MTGTNSSNDRLILRRNVEINSNWYFSYDVFSGMKSSTMWNGNAIAQSPRKMSELRDISNTSDKRFVMVYRTIINVILHLFINCNDLWCQLPLFSQTFRHNGSAVFGTMPPMCRSCPDVNKTSEGWILRSWDNIDLSCRLNRLYNTAGDKRWCPYAR